MSPLEDERLVLAAARREHGDAEIELVAYAMEQMRPEFCTPASRAYGETWIAAAQERDCLRAAPAPVVEDMPSPAAPAQESPAEMEPPKNAPSSATDASEPQPRTNGSPSEPYLGGFGWMNR